LGEKLPQVVGVTGVSLRATPEGQSPYGNLRSKFGFKAEGRNPSCSGWPLANRAVEQENSRTGEKAKLRSTVHLSTAQEKMRTPADAPAAIDRMSFCGTKGGCLVSIYDRDGKIRIAA